MSTDYHEVVATFNESSRPTVATCDLSIPNAKIYCYDCKFCSTTNPNFCGVDIAHKHAVLPSFLDFLAKHYPENLI